MPGLFLADANVYVIAANDAVFRQQFEAFIGRKGPLPISAIVAAEVLIGIEDPARHMVALRASLPAAVRPLL